MGLLQQVTRGLFLEDLVRSGLTRPRDRVPHPNRPSGTRSWGTPDASRRITLQQRVNPGMFLR
jgi:hypothetical protein